jgi:hypothetical protein
MSAPVDSKHLIRKYKIMKKIFYALIFLHFITSCGTERKKENPTKQEPGVEQEAGRNEKSEPKTTAKKPERKKPETAKTEKPGVKADKGKMTVEKYSMLNREQAKLLMEKYWLTFKDKGYDEVKDKFTRYKKEANDIFLEYGVTNKQELIPWAKKNRKEIKQFWKEHPEYEVYELYPEFSAANEKVHELAEAERNKK